jgi:hypothetical protein
VTAQSFLDQAGTTFTVEVGSGAAYQTTDIWGRLRTAILVYGTVREAGANRYAAEQLQKRFLDAYESAVAIRKDFEVTDDELRHRDVIFVGRPEANSALAAVERATGSRLPRRRIPARWHSARIRTRCVVICGEEPLGREAHGFGRGGQ